MLCSKRQLIVLKALQLCPFMFQLMTAPFLLAFGGHQKQSSPFYETVAVWKVD